MEKHDAWTYNPNMGEVLREVSVCNCLYHAEVHVADEGDGKIRTSGCYQDRANLVILGICDQAGKNLNLGSLSVVQNSGNLEVRCNLDCENRG
jgi:hypothetical protein